MATEKTHDIFLSYSSNDKERVRPIVEAIEKEGFTLWWDDNIPPGTTWRAFIQENLDAAQVVVVIWSKSSVKRRFVIDEAEEGLQRESLFPIFIDDVKAPIGLRSPQNIQLINWQGGKNEQLGKFIESIRAKLGHAAKPTKQKDKKSEQAWKNTVKTNTAAAFYDFLNHNWHSPHAKEALQKAQVLEEEEKQRAERLRQAQQQRQINPLGSQRPFTAPGTTNFNYWAKRLETIQSLDSSSAATSRQQYTPTVTEPGEKFVFYKSFAFWAALVVFPLLGLGGAWVAEQVVEWGSPSRGGLAEYFYTMRFWLYAAGAVWGILYLIQGTIEASDYDDWTELPLALWTPFENIFDFDETSLGGLITALPINLILSWGLTFAIVLYLNETSFSMNLSYILSGITLVQAVVYFRQQD